MLYLFACSTSLVKLLAKRVNFHLVINPGLQIQCQNLKLSLAAHLYFQPFDNVFQHQALLPLPQILLHILKVSPDNLGMFFTSWRNSYLERQRLPD